MARNHIPFLLLALLFFSGAAPAEINVSAAVADDDGLYPGEPFQYQISIEGYDQPGAPDMTPLADLSPSYVGGQNRSRSFSMNINGRRTQRSVQGYIMAYQLTADKPGRLLLPAVNVNIEGRIYKTNPLEVDILKPATSDSLDLQSELSDRRSYVGQPVTLSVRWYVSTGIADRIADYHFNIPVLHDNHNFFFEAAPSRGPGDSTQQIDLPSGPAVVRQSRARHQDDDCVLVAFDVILIPRRAGAIELPAATVAAKIDVSRRARSIFDTRRQYKRFLATASSMPLNVLPLPAEDRPPDFTGLVGRYRIRTAATPTEVNVGDPITLTIAISGDLLKMVTAPDLQSVPAFADNFKIPSEQAAPKLSRTGKTYTQTVRAKNEDITEIPPIPLSYFDVDQGAYITVHSDPIPLTVSPTRVVTADQAVGAAASPRTTRLQQIKTGLAANYDGPDLLKNVAFTPAAALTQPSYLALLGSPLAVFVIAAVLRVARRTSPARQAARRRTSAYRNAAASLKRRRDPAQIADVLRAYVADRYNRTAQSLTADDCAQLLRDDHKPSDLIDKFAAILETCELTRYGRSTDDSQTYNLHEISSLLKRLQ